MSNSKGKRTTRKAVSKERISQARFAISKGLLSNKAKLSGGKITNRVAKKLSVLEELGALPTFIFEAGHKRARILDQPSRALVKVKPALRRKMKEQGFEIFNSFALVPKAENGKADARYTNAIANNRPAGIKRIGQRAAIVTQDGLPRVRVDTVEIIALDTLGISNYADLHRALVLNQLENEAKYPDEIYSFTFFGYHPRGTSEYFTDLELLEKLETYKWTDQAFENFQLVRMRMGDTLGPTPDWVYKANRARSTRTVQDRRVEATLLKARKQKDARALVSIEHKREVTRVRTARYRERIYNDPAKHAAVKAKDLKRKARKKKNEAKSK